MIKTLRSVTILLIAVLFSFGCTSKDQLKKTIEENPDIILNAIEKHPKKFLDTLNSAVEKARSKAREEQEEKQKMALEEEFDKPKQPEISEDRVIFGAKNAPITIVEYSDFECPFCSKGFNVMKQVEKKYGDKVELGTDTKGNWRINIKKSFKDGGVANMLGE